MSFHDGASASTVLAALNSFTAFTIALFAHDGLLVVKLDHFAGVDVFESNLNLSLGRLDFSSLFLSCTTAASSAHAEDVKDITKIAHAASVLDSLETVLVIEFSLLLIAENFIGSVNFLESVLVSSFIRMMDESKLSESLSDILLSGFFRDTKNIIELLSVYVFFFIH